jgi:hypothetical protein
MREPLELSRARVHIATMTEKSKPPVVDADPKAIARWDTEGGAPASGDQSTIKHHKRPRDLNQWAKRMLDIATGEASDAAPTPEPHGEQAKRAAKAHKEKKPIAPQSGGKP